jgi:hypothetical protein
LTGRRSSCQSAAHSEILTASRNTTTHNWNRLWMCRLDIAA